MRRRLLALATCCALAVPAGARAADGDLTRYVDPMIGTLGAGFVFPGPAAPYGMIQNSPDTEGWFAYTGYQGSDQFIRGFSLVHTESMGVPEGGQIPFMPTVGSVVTDVKKYQSRFSHAMEDAEPGHYIVHLTSYDVNVELTAGMRAAMQRFRFLARGQANVLIDVGRQISGSNFDDVAQSTPGTNMASVSILEDGTILGTANLDRKADDGFPVHFAARFDRPFAGFGVWDARGAAPRPGVRAVTGKGAGMYLTFDTMVDQVVQVKAGISYVSQANALANLESELPGDDFGFEAMRARTRAAWNDALHAITVDGGTEQGKRSFYTALYHVQHHPNVFEDVNGEYIGYDHQVHRVGAPGDPMPPGSTYYANFSMWDTYRAEMPLLMLIAPDRVRDMMRSLAAVAIQGGRIPRWGWMDTYADFMNGEPGIQVIADAFCRGLVPPDAVPTLYGNMRALALDPDVTHPVRHRDPKFLTLGWVPYPGSGASSTLEHAIGDFALALVADELGATEDRDALLKLATNWRNIFDPATKFMRPRRADGSWLDPYLPENNDGWREGTGWQYTWLVPQDAGGLLGAMGADTARQRLDEFFGPASVPFAGPEAQQKISLYGITYYGNQYSPDNEHDLQAPWLYNWLGLPWKTQELQRSLQTLYRAAPDGLPGNDDLGTMSAWFVWSALGFYPVTPGSPTYAIGSPLFERATIRVPGGSAVVSAPGASLANKYVQSVALSGSPLAQTWFTHAALAAGGTVDFEMGPAPNLTWGAGAGAVPPSASTNPLSDFACTP